MKFKLKKTTTTKPYHFIQTSEEELAHNCTIRRLVAQGEGQELATVTQFHYIGWPDHGIPNDFDVILEMMAEMRDIKAEDAEKAPMVVHCR